MRTRALLSGLALTLYGAIPLNAQETSPRTPSAQQTAIYEIAVHQAQPIPKSYADELWVTALSTAGKELFKQRLKPQAVTAKERLSQQALTASSFYVDYDDEAVKDLAAGLAQDQYPNAKPWQSIVLFVNQTLTESGIHKGVLTASQTAKQGVGDCTEHAVLTTAMARLQQLPAQVVVGVVIVVEEGKASAYGHAWSEIQTTEGWVIADSALTALPDSSALYYLPTYAITSEGPSFSWDFVNNYIQQDLGSVAIRLPKN